MGQGDRMRIVGLDHDPEDKWFTFLWLDQVYHKPPLIEKSPAILRSLESPWREIGLETIQAISKLLNIPQELIRKINPVKLAIQLKKMWRQDLAIKVLVPVIENPKYAAECYQLLDLAWDALMERWNYQEAFDLFFVILEKGIMNIDIDWNRVSIQSKLGAILQKWEIVRTNIELTEEQKFYLYSNIHLIHDATLSNYIESTLKDKDKVFEIWYALSKARNVYCANILLKKALDLWYEKLSLLRAYAIVLNLLNRTREVEAKSWLLANALNKKEPYVLSQWGIMRWIVKVPKEELEQVDALVIELKNEIWI